MVTKEINLHGIQCNSIAMEVIGTTLNILLINGKQLKIQCLSKQDAQRIQAAILYYPTSKDNCGKSFDFDFKISIPIIT